ncbi:MAG: hypoxanthine phosphoribosyltransferase [Candidatus Eremiobacteraeota bacterium]|nr:hypoxanthine phosphoribosyltransferase [Candidatus Eremiobacteraeota bacterium]
MKPSRYEETIERTIFTAAQIREAVERLAVAIAADHRRQPLLLVGVLKGALYVTADLLRALSYVPGGPSEIQIDYLAVSSYGNANRSSGEVRLLKDTTENVSGANVVIVEDIIDNGLTLGYLQGILRERGPKSLKSCVLFDKPYNRRVGVHVDYIGLTAPDAFVVGYGLDYQEAYRNLPYLAQLHSWVFTESTS